MGLVWTTRSGLIQWNRFIRRRQRDFAVHLPRVPGHYMEPDRTVCPNTSKEPYIINILEHPSISPEALQHQALAMSSELPEPTPKHKAKLCFGAPYLFLRKKYKKSMISPVINMISPMINHTHSSIEPVSFLLRFCRRRKKTVERASPGRGQEDHMAASKSAWGCMSSSVRDSTTNLLPRLCPPPSYHLHLRRQTACLALIRNTAISNTTYGMHMLCTCLKLHHYPIRITCILLETGCHSPSKSECWNLNAQYDSIRRQGFGELIRSWGGALRSEISAL